MRLMVENDCKGVNVHKEHLCHTLCCSLSNQIDFELTPLVNTLGVLDIKYAMYVYPTNELHLRYDADLTSMLGRGLRSPLVLWTNVEDNRTIQ